MTENAKETAQESTTTIRNVRKIKDGLAVGNRTCSECAFMMRFRLYPNGEIAEPRVLMVCHTLIRLVDDGLTEICSEFIANPEPGVFGYSQKDVRFLKMGKDPEFMRSRRARLEYLRALEKKTIQLPSASDISTRNEPHFRFDVQSALYLCSKCVYTSASKETAKSHFRRAHKSLPDRTIETNPRRKSPQLDAKFQGDDSGGLG